MLEGADEFHEIGDLILRHATLAATNQDLKEQRNHSGGAAEQTRSVHPPVTITPIPSYLSPSHALLSLLCAPCRPPTLLELQRHIFCTQPKHSMFLLCAMSKCKALHSGCLGAVVHVKMLFSKGVPWQEEIARCDNAPVRLNAYFQPIFSLLPSAYLMVIFSQL